MANLKGDGKAFLAIFIGAIITAVLIGAIADQVFLERNILQNTNITITAAASNETIDLQGRTLVSEFEIYNSTNSTATNEGTVNGPNNLVLRSAISSTTGLQTVQLFSDDNNSVGNYSGSAVNISYTFEGDGYLRNSGARSIAGLIIIFGALGILIFVIATLLDKTGGSSLAAMVKRN